MLHKQNDNQMMAVGVFSNSLHILMFLLYDEGVALLDHLFSL